MILATIQKQQSKTYHTTKRTIVFVSDEPRMNEGLSELRTRLLQVIIP